MLGVQWVNLASVGLLVFAPGNLQLEAAVYALADGPLAAALIVWQSAWVFGSPSHVIRCSAEQPCLLRCPSSEVHFPLLPAFRWRERPFCI